MLKLRIGDPINIKTDVGPLIRSSEVDRVHAMVKMAVKDGAVLVCGGNKLSNTTYECTILKNPSLESEVSQKEIFGPVINIFGFNDIDEAISSEEKLAIGLFKKISFVKGGNTRQETVYKCLQYIKSFKSDKLLKHYSPG